MLASGIAGSRCPNDTLRCLSFAFLYVSGILRWAMPYSGPWGSYQLCNPSEKKLPLSQIPSKSQATLSSSCPRTSHCVLRSKICMVSSPKFQGYLSWCLSMPHALEVGPGEFLQRTTARTQPQEVRKQMQGRQRQQLSSSVLGIHTQSSEQWGMWIPHRFQQGSNGISSEFMEDSLNKEGADGRTWLCDNPGKKGEGWTKSVAVG